MSILETFRATRQTLQAIRAVQKHCTSRDNVTVSLSYLSTARLEAAAGKPSKYQLWLSNATGAGIWGTITIGVIGVEITPQRTTPRIVFVKVIYLPAESTQCVVVSYDWARTAEFTVDGVRFPPDNADFLSPLKAGNYRLEATVSVNGEKLEALDIHQELIH